MKGLLGHVGILTVCATLLVFTGCGGGSGSGAPPQQNIQTPKSYSYTVLYTFCSNTCNADGYMPYGGLVEDASGNFYGTTSQGGISDGICTPWGCGTVFKLDSAGNYTVLHKFCSQANCADGEVSQAGLIRDSSGNLYGTTVYGGAYSGLGGTVFKLDSAGNYTVLHSFCSQANCADGSEPQGRLVRDASGNLYGTTIRGGTGTNCPYPSGCGTIFKLDSGGNFTVLYNFCSQAYCADGNDDFFTNAGLILDGSGNLYGTTNTGGTGIYAPGSSGGGGTVFKLDSAGNYTVLYAFCSLPGCTDGYHPFASLIRDSGGNLYGTTYNGGNGISAIGGGTVFKLDSAGQFTVLHIFCTQPNCTDGGGPETGVIQDASGNFYGTTTIGGPPLHYGAGTVFKLDSAGNYTTLYMFCSQAGCTDGYSPYGDLIEDGSGTLYGTTRQWGNGTIGGVIFKLY